jgi:hypothetical protein
MPHKLLGLERFLAKYPEWQGKVTLIQVCTNTNADPQSSADGAPDAAAEYAAHPATDGPAYAVGTFLQFYRTLPTTTTRHSCLQDATHHHNPPQSTANQLSHPHSSHTHHSSPLTRPLTHSPSTCSVPFTDDSRPRWECPLASRMTTIAF